MTSVIAKQPGDLARGATLAEVLLAVMLMGIGVVTLATLFPLSILRAAHASQLTGATILRYNAQAAIEAHPQLVFDPDADGDVDEHTVPPHNVYVVDPLGNALVRGAFQNKEDANNNWLLDAGEDADMDMQLDPGTFGNDGSAPAGTLQRFAGGYVDRNGNGGYDVGETNFALAVDAARLTAQSDNWIFQTDVVPAGFTPTSLTLPATVVVSNVPAREIDADLDGVPEIDLDLDGRTGTIDSRVVLFSSSGRAGQTREITRIDGQQIRWDEDFDLDGTLDPGEDRNGNAVLDQHNLPDSFVPERVRILTRDRRYSWMLSVRNTSADGAYTASVSVVVFFRRPVDDPTVEEIYSSWSAAPARSALQKSSNLVRIDYSGRTKPSLQKGSFVLDAAGGHWYRIADVLDDATARRATLTIDRPAVATSEAAVLMRGIVDVYPIGTIELSQ